MEKGNTATTPGPPVATATGGGDPGAVASGGGGGSVANREKPTGTSTRTNPDGSTTTYKVGKDGIIEKTVRNKDGSIRSQEYDAKRLHEMPDAATSERADGTKITQKRDGVQKMTETVRPDGSSTLEVVDEFGTYTEHFNSAGDLINVEGGDIGPDGTVDVQIEDA